MNKTMISRSALAERWDLDSNTIYKYEKDGIITRNPNIPTPRYSLEEIIAMESFDKSPTSPYERKRLNKEIKELKEENRILKEILFKFSNLGIEGFNLLKRLEEI